MKIHDVVALHGRDAVALTDGKRSWTHGQLDEAIRAIALDGIRAGDRVMLLCENRMEDVAWLFALSRRGAWPVVVNAKLTEREVEDIRAHAGARAIVRGGAVSALNEDSVPEADADVAVLIYTSGTTGKPKGVMLTHDGLLFVARESGKVRGYAPGDTVHGVLPISHILGLTGVLLSSLLFGAAVHMARRFDPAQAFASDVSVMIGTPSMYQMLAEYARRRNIAPGKRLRLMCSAGAPLDMATKSAAEEALGRPLYNGYGITECGPTITLTPLDAPRGDCGIGALLPGVEAKLVGDELFVRGPGVMKGYYRAPDETAAVLDAEGWYRSGDLARFENGSWFITGRAKEMIIRFGFNVYPAEVEGVLNAHPAVARSAVLGRGKDGSEEVIAFVHLADGAPHDVRDIADHAARTLAPYKRPSEIRIVPQMPLSPAGKILKQELAAQLA